MKNAKVDDKSKFLLSVMAAILIVAAAFFLGYRNMEEKAKKIEAQNAELETRIAALQMYFDTEEQNRKDTEDMTAEIKSIFSQYSGDARIEDGIYEAFNLNAASVNTLVIKEIGFATPDVLTSISAETVQAAKIEEYNEEIRFVEFDVTYDGMTSYEGLKGMIKEMTDGDYDLAIGNMSYHINENNYVEGTTLLSFYSVTGAGCDYTEPEVAEYETGIGNLFGITTSIEEK